MITVKFDRDFILGISEGVMIASTLREKIEDRLTIPLIAVMQNNEVVDHITTSDENELISFLKKNGFIGSE